MQSSFYKCTKRVGGDKKGDLCGGISIKHGTTGAGKQRYKCKACAQTSIANYKNKSYTVSDEEIIILVKESCGVRSIGRILKLSNTTVIKRILQISKQIKKPALVLNKSYEVDEMRTFCKSKSRQFWVVTALQKDNKRVADFVTGRRTKLTLQKITDTLLLSNAFKICTDKLHLYKLLIPASVHCTKQYGTNNVERKHLSIRTHIKRLSRKTICFSRSLTMLSACLKIYFWS